MLVISKDLTGKASSSALVTSLHVLNRSRSQSSKMGPKQREMDAVFEKLYLATRERDRRDRGKTLLVLVGDHGMSEVIFPVAILSLLGGTPLTLDFPQAGNHGGSTEGETSAVRETPLEQQFESV